MPKKYSVEDTVSTTTLDMDADVSDNSKLFRAITKNVASMIESISLQICEFEDKTLESMDIMRADLESKVNDNGGRIENLMQTVRAMPDHDSLMNGVHGLLAEHLGDGHGKIMSEIQNLPLDKSHKVMMQTIANMEESVLGATLEAVESLKRDMVEKSTHDNKHLLLKIQANLPDGLEKQIRAVQDDIKKMCTSEIKELRKEVVDTRVQLSTSIKKSLDSMLGGHADGHKGIMSEMRTFNKQLDTVLKQTDQSKMKGLLDEHSKALHGKLDDHAKGVHFKLDSHSKKHDDIVTLVNDMPDHDTLMKGVHNLMADHMNDHGGKLMSEINKMPLPPDEKLMLQTMENMQEAVLGEVLGAIESLKADIEGHTSSLHSKFDDHGKRADDMMAAMPDHDAVLEGVHDLLGKHLSDSHGKFSSEIDKLPLNQHEKVIVQAVENLEETVLATVMEGLECLRRDVSKLETSETLKKILNSMPDGLDKQMKALQEDTKKACTSEMKELRKEVAETRGQLSTTIKKSLDSVLTGHADGQKSLTAELRSLSSKMTGAYDMNKIKGWLDDHSKGIHGKIDDQSRKHDALHNKHDELAKILRDKPDYNELMKGVHGVVADHMKEHSGKLSSQLDQLPLPPDEKVILQAIEDMAAAMQSSTSDGMQSLKAHIQGHSEALHGKIDDHTEALHGKIDGHGEKHDSIIAMLDGMPSHENLMEGVHGLLGEHLGDGHGKIMSEIQNLPLNQSEKVMLQAIENMEESMLGTVMEGLESVKKDLSKGETHEMLRKILASLPDMDKQMKAHHEDTRKAYTAEITVLRKEVIETRGHIKKASDSILSGHSDVHKSLTAELRGLGKNLDAHIKQSDLTKVKAWLEDQSKGIKGKLDEHSKNLHGKLDSHSKTHDDLAKMLDAVPDHDTLVKGVHGVLSEAMGEHSGKLSKEVNSLPLPPDEKILLQAIEGMQEAVLSETLEAIAKLKADLEDHHGALHGKFEDHGKRVDDLMAVMDNMPDHEQLMQGVHGLLGDHMGDGHGKIMDEIKSLPLDQSQQVMLQAIEKMEESVLGATLEAIQGLKNEIAEHSSGIQVLHGKLDGHGRNVDELTKLMDSMPDHDTLLKGVHGIMGEHLGDGHGKIMDEIKSLPLDHSQQVMLQAIENMEETLLTSVLEAIQNIQMNVSVQGVNVSSGTPASSPAKPAPSPAKPRAADAWKADAPKTAFDWKKADAPKTADAWKKTDVPKTADASRTTDPPKRASSVSPTRASFARKSDGSSWTSSPAGRRAASNSAVKRVDSITEPKRRMDPTPGMYCPPVGTSGKDGFSCKCGFTCGTSAALTRHLDKNTGWEHGQV